jgi:dTMP kinase
MFVVIEGIDGTGKSTLAHALKQSLGERAVLTREPTDRSKWGKRLREAGSKGRLSREKEIEYFHRDRLHHLETLIRPALEQGKIVISDRYVDSMLAYQALDVADADRLYQRLAPELLEPDLVILLDLPVEVALNRIAHARGAASKFELKETLERAHRIYASRHGTRYHRIDAQLAPAKILGEALRLIEAASRGSTRRS